MPKIAPMGGSARRAFFLPVVGEPALIRQKLQIPKRRPLEMSRLHDNYSPIVVKHTRIDTAARKIARRAKRTVSARRTLRHIAEDWDYAIASAQSALDAARIDAAYRRQFSKLERQSHY